MVASLPLSPPRAAEPVTYSLVLTGDFEPTDLDFWLERLKSSVEALGELTATAVGAQAARLRELVCDAHTILRSGFHYSTVADEEHTPLLRLWVQRASQLEQDIAALISQSIHSRKAGR